MRRSAILVVLVGALAFAANGTAANHTTVTETDHVHGSFSEPEFDVNPCSGAAITSFDATGNVVDHVTYFVEDGAMTEVWATFTETGMVVATDASGATYTGRFTAWGNFNLNERNTNDTFTLSFMLAGSDGSTLQGHEVTHFALNANGDVTVDFDRMSLSCG